MYSKFKEQYKGKLKSLEEAAKLIQSGDKIVANQFVSEPIGILNAIGKRAEAGEFDDVEVLGLGPTSSTDWITPEIYPHLRASSVFINSAKLREGVSKGYANYIPDNVSGNAASFKYRIQDLEPGKAKVISASAPMDKNGYFCTATAPLYFHDVAKMENTTIIMEVNENQPYVFGDNFIHISQVDCIVESNRPLFTIPPVTEGTPEEIAIADLLLDMIEDGSTIQLGIGGMPNVLGRLLANKHDLGAHTEMLGDAYKYLWELGVLNGRKKTLCPNKICACFAMGSAETYKWMHENPSIEMHSTSWTNNSYVIGQNNKLIAINQAVEVDLTGQVASESIGPRQHSGTGGQLDFVRGAQLSSGGKAFICLRSTANTKKGRVSKIAPLLNHGTTVTVPRHEVNYVVTEYGVAQLRGKTMRERAQELIGIAHPDFRDELREEAKKLNLIN
ncbi:acetyl-CoA hydrolase/transferase family protein [Desulfosporosinus lacus]|uniref:Acyl-CoA hydrolase n=1 Tax=Desulfosporosinus lacus DSM 15449 TaxID=1121420 RepID=A0A1M5XKG1_9FIRM|nr:acetyl-CoA hydrolase/transferase C-terminal domain-containing protein [Desulfosporosinus lacus]SHI00337.1 Acyl-CoA hydrolase [Desulfosporosinus lacus DSM 15449]